MPPLAHHRVLGPAVAAIVALVFISGGGRANGAEGGAEGAAEGGRREGVVVSAPWVRAVPPSARMSAAYMVLENRGDDRERLLGASSDIATTIELHHVRGEGGMMLMYPVEAIVLPAGERLELKPGGYHIMLIGLTRPLLDSDAVSLTLHFERAGERVVSLPVGDGGSRR